jgi:hypothetical protein
MLSASETTVSNPVLAGSNLPGPGRHLLRRIAAPAVVLSAGALLLVGIANVQVARERSTVERQLATARRAAARVPEHLASRDGNAVATDLDLLIRSAGSAHAGSNGLSWRLASRADLNGTEVRAVRRGTEQAATLAAAAVQLRTALGPLTAGSDTQTLDRPDAANALNDLDDLARGLSRYAEAARHGVDPATPALERAAVAAGLLPVLAGSEGPRTWTVCRAATGPCRRTTVTAAEAGLSAAVTRPGTGTTPGAATPPGRPEAGGADLLVVGMDPSALFARPGKWDAAAVFHLLYHLDPGLKVPLVTVRSAVGPEQQAIDGLSRRQW